MDDALYHSRHELLFNTRRSRRYHMWRVKFFRRLNNVRLFLFLISSSTAFTLIMSETYLLQWVPWASAFVVLIALGEVVVRAGTREIQHHNLARAFVELEAEIISYGERLTDARLDALKTKYLKIELDEPPVLKALNDICYNEEAMARYDDPKPYLIQIGLLDRIWAQVLDIRPHKITPPWTALTEQKQ